MFKKVLNYIVETIKEEYKFIIVLLLVTIILNIPLNYYVTIGGGISDASDRIKVEDKYESKGSFNISYVTQLDGTILTMGLSYIIPSWERESADDYKYDKEESLDDIEFRNKLSLENANSYATYWGYTLAKKEIKELSRKTYVIGTISNEYPTNLKVQDQILSVDDQTYNNAKEYSKYIQTKEVGEEVDVKVIRKKKEQVVKTKIYETEGVKLIGVLLESTVEYDTKPPLEIKFKNRESGPSGGLITTLEIYNQLTKKDLTNGKTIAGTGTIEADGTIGEIGGIEHKVKGATHAKADIFLSPSGDNYNDAKKYIEKNNLKIKLIKVDTIEDAIEKLERIKK